MIKQEYANIVLQLRDTIISEVDRRLAGLPPTIPCRVVSRSGPVVSVLTTVNLGASPKQMDDIPIAKSRYHNDPISAGDKGMLIPCSYIFDGLILDPPKDQINSPLKATNLGGYMFFPLADQVANRDGAGDTASAIYSQDGDAWVAVKANKLIAIRNTTTDLKTLLSAEITAINGQLLAISNTLNSLTGSASFVIPYVKTDIPDNFSGLLGTA